MDERVRSAGCGVAAVLATVALAALASCGSSGSDEGASATNGPAKVTTTASAEAGRNEAIQAVADRLFPSAPDPDTADMAEEHCQTGMTGMPGMGDDMGLTESTEFVERTAADGSHERVYGGINPRTEVSSMPFDTPVTKAESDAAAAFVKEVGEAIVEHGWTDPKKAAAAGYRPMQMCATHWVNLDAALDDKVLDPDHPEFLVIEMDAKGRNYFHSVMFMAASNTAHGPQPFGSMATWHYHDGGGCQIEGLLAVPQTSSVCPKGTKDYGRTPEMLHVNTTGPPFSPSM